MPVPARIRPGELLETYPGGTHNWLVDNMQQLIAERSGRGPRSGAAQSTVLVVNKSGEDLEKWFAVLKLDGPLNKPADREGEPYRRTIRFKGVKPDEDTESGKARFCICQKFAKQDGLIKCVLTGETWAKLDIQSEDDTTCGPVKDDIEKLKTGQGSTPIVWKESGTGIKWGIVQLGGGAASPGTSTLDVVVLDEISAATIENDDGTPRNNFNALSKNGKLVAGWGKARVLKSIDDDGDLHHDDPTDDNLVFEFSEDDDIIVYNMVRDAIQVNKTIQVKEIYGRYWADAMDCT